MAAHGGERRPGTVGERIGALERAGRLREALALARAADREAAARPADEGAAAAASLERARLAWRVGRSREASAALRPLLAGAHGSAGTPARIEALLLRATMAMERGAATRARATLEAARAAAEESGDDEALARVLRRAGTLDARAGRPSAAAGAYRAALAALARVAAPEDARLDAALRSNLATMETWLGHHDAAEALYRAALARRAGEPIEALNTRAALALLDGARCRRPAGGSFEPLVEEAERLGEPRLRAELAAYRAEELVLEGRLTAAERHLAAARVALADLGGTDRILDALVDVAAALLRARRGERGAAASLARAVDGLEHAGARYHAARSARLGATARVWLGDDDGAIELVARAATLAEPAGLVLGDELVHAVALALAATRGAEPARGYAVASLDRLGPIRVEAALRREGRGDLARRWSAEPHPMPVGAPFRAIGPEGALPLTLVERDALCAAGGAVVLDRPRHTLWVPGARPRNLARMRLVEPLLAHLVARRPDGADLEEIARAVWDQRPSTSVVAAITTSIARLRRLLGSAARIVTTGEGARRAYGLGADAVVWRIDAAGR